MRFIIGFLVTIGLLIFVMVLIFRGGGDGDTPAETQKRMVDYANSATTVQMTTDNPTSADQTHRQMRITVGSTETIVEVFTGYQQTLVNTKSYANNSAAYADFLAALELNGYTKGNADKSVADERGYCSTGQRYVFNIKDGDKDIQRFWSSSCGTGTFKGKTEAVRALFIKQIPDYDVQTAAFNR